MFVTELNKCEKPVFVIGTTNRIDTLDPALRSHFRREISVDVPDESSRLKSVENWTALTIFGFLEIFEIVLKVRIDVVFSARRSGSF